jgi:adenosine deaminase
VLAYVNDHRIPLEVCLSSNVQTRAVRHAARAPVRRVLPAGNPGHAQHRQPLISATDVTNEMLLAARAFRLSPYELKRIVINGFKSAFLPYAQKARMLREVNLEIDRLFMEEFPDEYDRRASF